MSKLLEIAEGGHLRAMVATPYGKETELQQLLQDHPDLLSGGDLGEQAQWLLIKREMSVSISGTDPEGNSATGYIDHLFVDRDGVPTLVEVKRVINTESRRAVAGQILDYAANAPLHWTAESLRQAFESSVQGTDGDPSDRLARFLQPTVDTESAPESFDPDEFWGRVQHNLEEGRLKLVFVMDVVPLSLLRIVEFLNRQMATVEVFAIEVRRHSGEGRQILEVQRRGESAFSRARTTSTRRDHERPSIEDWMKNFAERHGPEMADGAKVVLDFMTANGRVFTTSSGDPALGLHLTEVPKGRYPLFIKGAGRLSVLFSYLIQNPATSDWARRKEWAEKLLKLADGRGRYGDKLNSDLVFEKEILADPIVLARVLDGISGLIKELRG